MRHRESCRVATLAVRYVLLYQPGVRGTHKVTLWQGKKSSAVLNCSSISCHPFSVTSFSPPAFFCFFTLACNSHSYRSTGDAASRASFSFTARHYFFFSDGSLSYSFYLCCCKIGTAAQHICVTNHYSQGKWKTKLKRTWWLFYRCFLKAVSQMKVPITRKIWTLGTPFSGTDSAHPLPLLLFLRQNNLIFNLHI